MEQRRLALLLQGLAYRLRDYPEAAIDEMLNALEAIERKYDIL
jgi:hypothetical protein